jgi:hypothetical protein
MNKALIALAMGAAVTASAAPAMAQTWGYYSNSYSAIRAREDRLSERIDQTMSDGAITMSQASALRSDLNRVIRLDRSYRWDGLTLGERDDLVSRLNSLEANLRYDVAQSNINNEEYGYGYYR